MSNYRNDETLANQFKALSHPHRLALFKRLMTCCPPGTACSTEEAACCVGDLCDGLDIAASTVSHHLKELTRAGLVKTRRQGRTVLCWVEPDCLQDLAGFFVGETNQKRGETR